MSDRGRDVSNALTEVRTVLSRTRNALAKFDRGWIMESEATIENGIPVAHRAYKDPDYDEIVAALRDVEARLERWERTGRALKAKEAS